MSSTETCEVCGCHLYRGDTTCPYCSSVQPDHGVNSKQRDSTSFKRGFLRGIRDVLIITFVLFLTFLFKVLAIPFAVILFAFVSFMSGPGDGNLQLGASLVYLIIAFGLNVGFKILKWIVGKRLSHRDTFGNVVGSLAAALVISPFAYSLAIIGFFAFL